MRSGERQHGFTLLAVLAAMFLLALATQGVMTVVSQQAQREREALLLRVGAAYAQAIRSYYDSSPGAAKRWPQTLAELADDKRFVDTRRHLREVYADPITRSPEWGLVTDSDGGIRGVFSRSDAAPIRTVAIDLQIVELPAARRYSDWVFEWQPGKGTGR